MTARAGREPGGARGSLGRQRRLPVRKLAGQRGGFGQTLLIKHRRTVAAQADLRERGELGRKLCAALSA